MRAALSFVALAAQLAAAAFQPIVINTWFPSATQAAYDLASENYTALDSVQAGVQSCEDAQCDTTVGWGNHPDSTGETTLDAIIMDGVTMNAGSGEAGEGLENGPVNPSTPR